MNNLSQQLSLTFRQFVDSEKSAGFVLIGATVLSLGLANSAIATAYVHAWHSVFAGLSLEHWINDGFMAVFFLLIGLELERELYNGELSSLRNALLPIVAALGGMIVPVLIHLALNIGTPTQAGFGIPMATDIAFVLGMLVLLGSRIPPTLKVFVVAFAVIDDLGAVIAIAVFYTNDVSLGYLFASLAIWVVLCLMNWRFRVMALTPYLLGGALLWLCMLASGIHATLAGVLLAFAIPFSARSEDSTSPSHRLEAGLHKPVAFVVLPLFALANTAIPVTGDWLGLLLNRNGLGIAAGLLLGKSLGIVLFCYAAIRCGICHLPRGVGWQHITGAGILGGIGFTMSIFITNLAFAGNTQAIDASKLVVLSTSLVAAIVGCAWLFVTSKPDN